MAAFSMSKYPLPFYCISDKRRMLTWPDLEQTEVPASETKSTGRHA